MTQKQLSPFPMRNQKEYTDSENGNTGAAITHTEAPTGSWMHGGAIAHPRHFLCLFSFLFVSGYGRKYFGVYYLFFLGYNIDRNKLYRGF